MVSLSNEAYAVLAGLKRSGESFSQVALRLAAKEKKPGSILDLAGAWGTKGGEKETQRIIDEIYAMRRGVKIRRFHW